MRFNAIWQQEYGNYNEINMCTIAISAFTLKYIKEHVPTTSQRTSNIRVPYLFSPD